LAFTAALVRLFSGYSVVARAGFEPATWVMSPVFSVRMCSDLVWRKPEEKGVTQAKLLIYKEYF
jgi:hypothetical protein